MIVSKKSGMRGFLSLPVCLLVCICLLAGCSSESKGVQTEGNISPADGIRVSEADVSIDPQDSGTALLKPDDSGAFENEKPRGTDTADGQNGDPASEDTDEIPADNTAPTDDAEVPADDTAPTDDAEVSESDEAQDGAFEAESTKPDIPDTTPPVFKEYRSHLVYIGDTVSYRSGVIITDDSGEEPVLTIDSSEVNLKEPGEYPLIYTATDSAGNSASCEVTVVVREREDVSQEMLDAKADEIIEKVLGDAPRDIEALETLFKWTSKNIRYVNYFEQNDDISAAWEGLVFERGDCYVYACASKELLTRAGFKNDMIRTARHYWNLVDLGEGWYHYDTCPRKDKPYFFMWGDGQLMEYSKANGNSHDYDHTKWPDVMP